MTKILVTGSSGFIGKNLLPRLRSHQYSVSSVSRLDGEISDAHTWDKFQSSEVLIHLAGLTFVPDSWKDPSRFIKTNLDGVTCALDYCRKHGSRLIYLSSYLYGNPEFLPIPESAPLIANNPYALSKKMAEEVCKFYAEFYGVKITILRPFNVYGPGQSQQFLIPSIIAQASAGTPILVQDLNPRRDYVYIDDLVDAIINAINKQLEFEVFNIGTGISYSVAELINIIQKIMGTNLNVVCNGEKRIGEIVDTQANILQALKILDWKPKYTLEAGLKKIII